MGMRVTLGIIFLCVAVFIGMSFLSQDMNKQIVERYGFSGQNLFSHPEVLITSIFIHGDIDHLLSNILVLFFFGAAVESELGSKKTLLIFLLGAWIGDIFSMSFYFLGIYPWTMPSIGASAGVFALIGTGMLVRPFDFSFYPYFMPVPLGLLGLIYAVYNAIGFAAEGFGAAASNISYIAHFGGLIVGLYFGFQREGWQRGMKIILVMFMIMILIPYVWTTLGRII
ncbi:MAG: hypothetical protein B6U68_01225 [Candidatus Aenigmarchaeota archaeon ex4484_14]|nr:MAG: hypothetical protein B6U68_01225 [Candidatus Aenigmarchaeota archaeon ex4484_14]